MTLHSHPVHPAFTTNAVRQAMRIAGPNQKATVPSPDFGNLLARAAAAESTALPKNSNSPVAQPTASAPQSAQPQAAAVIAASPAGPNFSTATVGTPAQGYVPAGKTVVAPAGLVGGAPGVTSSAFVLPSAAGLGYQDYMALVNADNPGVFGNTSINSARITQSQALNEAASAEYINDPLSGLHIPPGSVAV